MAQDFFGVMSFDHVFIFVFVPGGGVDEEAKEKSSVGLVSLQVNPVSVCGLVAVDKSDAENPAE